ELLHQLYIADHVFAINRTAFGRMLLVAVHTFYIDRHTVHQQLRIFYLYFSKTRMHRRAGQHFASIVDQRVDGTIQMGRLSCPFMDIGILRFASTTIMESVERNVFSV